MKNDKKKITYFYMNGCPYCQKANKAIEELILEKPEYAAIEIERINENDPPAGFTGFDYYYVPSMFIGKEKILKLANHSGRATCRFFFVDYRSADKKYQQYL